MSYDAELGFIADQLARIADALERIAPPPPAAPKRCEAKGCNRTATDILVQGLRLRLCAPHRAELTGGQR